MFRNHCSITVCRILQFCLAPLLLLAAAPGVSGEMEIWPDANTWPGGDLYPLGPIGGRAEVKLGWPEMRVRDLLPGCPGEKAGLALGDVIIAANGKKFEPAAEDGDKAGKGPLETLGYCIDESEGYDGKLFLDILRQGKKQRITVQLQPIGAFSAKYPANCPKSEAYYDAICAHLAKIQDQGGGWPGGQVTSDICALALLGRADGKYMKNVTHWANSLLNSAKGIEQGTGWDSSNWMCGYDLVFLGEYYWATKDPRVPPAMTGIMEAFAKRQGNRGHFGHGTEKPFAYDDKGLIMPASACMWGFAMANQCNIKIPEDCWYKFIEYVHQSSGIHKDVSWVGYNHSCVDTGQANGRTGNMCLALYISERDRKWAEMMGRFLAQNKKYTLQGHTVTTLGNVSAVPALFLSDPKGYREYLDYWKWYLRLTQLPAGYACFLPNRGNFGGDGYLNLTTIVNGTIGLMLASSQGNLYMYGKFLDIEGLKYFSLTPPMQSVYMEFVKKQVSRQSIDTLKSMSENKTASNEDRNGAGKLLARLSTEYIAPRLDEVQAWVNINEMFTARNLLDAAENDFGEFMHTLPAYMKLDAALGSPAGKQQIELGKEYFGLLADVDRTSDPKNRLYNDKNLELKFRDQLRHFADRNYDNIYAKLATERLDGATGRALVRMSAAEAAIAEAAAPRLEEVQASVKINDMFTARKLLDATKKDLGEFVRMLPAYVKLDKTLSLAENKQQIGLGKEYFELLDALDRSIDPKNREYSDKNFELKCRDKLKEFSDQHYDNTYAKLATERLDGGTGRPMAVLSPYFMFFARVVAPSLEEVQASMKINDMFTARKLLDAADKNFGESIHTLPSYLKMDKALETVGARQQIELGKEYFELLEALDRADDPKNRLYTDKNFELKCRDKLKEFADRHYDNIYAKLATERLDRGTGRAETVESAFSTGDAQAAAPSLNEAQGLANVNDMFTARKILDAAEKHFGDVIHSLPACTKLEKVLDTPGAKQQIVLGREYFELLDALDRSSDPKNRQYSDKNFELKCRDKLKEFSDQHGDNLYGKLAIERLNGGTGRAVAKSSLPISQPSNKTPAVPKADSDAKSVAEKTPAAKPVTEKSVAIKHEPAAAAASSGPALSKNVSDKALQPWIMKVREYVCAATQKGNTPRVNLSAIGGKGVEMRILSSSDKELIVEVGGGSVPLDWSLITSRADWYNLAHAFTKEETSAELTLRAVFLQATGRSKEAEDYFARAVVMNPAEASAVKRAQESLQERSVIED